MASNRQNKWHILEFIKTKALKQKTNIKITLLQSHYSSNLTIMHMLLTFSWHITRYDTTGKFSISATSASGEQQALRHSWTCCTPVCGTYANTSTAELLTLKWIKLLLVFSWGVSTTTGSEKPCSSILDSDPISVRMKVLSAGISHADYFWFPAALPEYPTGGLELSGKNMNFWNCLHKVNWVTLIVQEMQNHAKGSLKLFYLPVLFLHCWPCWLGRLRSR